ncbi:uncharacterized protein LOC106664179 [Cimex lectularius]|uniref:Ninjurin n=1 Tax=Cimex lectularius TaxID=79782 RepID=A0A8I6RFD1_CIMLE|nr:uncharacterized protein LOC106664179 [Cimex lectularius]
MQEPGPGEVEVLEDNGKQYPPKWIPVHRKEPPENLPEDEEKPNQELYYFKQDMSLLLCNLVLFCINLDILREEMSLVDLIRTDSIIMLSVSIALQVVLVLIMVLNSSLFENYFKPLNSNILNNLSLSTIVVLLIINATIWVYYISEIKSFF